MSLRQVMKPHMKNSVVTITMAPVLVEVEGLAVTDLVVEEMAMLWAAHCAPVFAIMTRSCCNMRPAPVLRPVQVNEGYFRRAVETNG